MSATAQPCVAGKQPVGLLPPRLNGFACFVGFVMNYKVSITVQRFSKICGISPTPFTGYRLPLAS